MGDDSAVQGSMAESVRNAKAGFPRIDSARLRSFIEAQPDVDGSVTLSELRYPTDGAGASNGIAFFTATFAGGSGTETLDLVLRYSPGVLTMKQKSFADEFQTLRAVAGTDLPVPRALWLDATGEDIGRIGYVMEAVAGDTPSAAMYSNGPLANIAPAERKERMLKAAGFHGRLRAAAIGADRVPHLATRGEGGSAIERELNWWFREVSMVWDAGDPKAATIAAVRAWLIDHQPRDLYTEALVHGDAQIANMIYANGDIAAVIDWELSYLGHNEADLSLLCFLTRVHHVIDIPVDGTPTDEEYIARYEQEGGHSVRHWEYFKLMTLYRVASVSSLAADFMPSFDAVWAFYREHMESAWAEAKAIYGE